MNFKENESAEKLRGSYYTPAPLAKFITDWIWECNPKTILEPSCGDGSFLEAIGLRYLKNSLSCLSVDAVELFEQEARKAAQVGANLQSIGIETQVYKADFFNWIYKTQIARKWDAIIGNPPYIRYQYFDNEQREIASKIFAKAGVPFSKRTNAWVPFVIASVMHLAPGGRLGMVLPAEILHIMHADGLRLLLEQEMSEITLFDVQDLVFESALQGIVILQAVKRLDRDFCPLEKSNRVIDNFSSLSIYPIKSLKELEVVSLAHSTNPTHQLAGRWTRALLETHENNLLNKIEKLPAIKAFSDIASVDIGIVTGANKFFVATSEIVKKYKFEAIAFPMLAKSELIQGITYTKEDQEANVKAGKPVFFLEFPAIPKSELPMKMRQYIELGETEKLHTRYKCRIRNPWYVVPYIWVSEIALLKRCHHFPRLVLNTAKAYSTDTAYRIVMNALYKSQEKEFIFSFLNSLTFLTAELEGRHYGGGVLELVPSEIERLAIPLVHPTEEQFYHVDEMIRKGCTVNELLDYTDPIVIGTGSPLNLSNEEISILRNARQRLQFRRQRLADPNRSTDLEGTID